MKFYFLKFLLAELVFNFKFSTKTIKSSQIINRKLKRIEQYHILVKECPKNENIFLKLHTVR